MVLGLSAREDVVKLHVEDSFKMEAKLEDRRNLASSRSYKYLLTVTPQGFFL